jgi:uncharacterized protein involved in exopolysaccharide biosynthesis
MIEQDFKASPPEVALVEEPSSESRAELPARSAVEMSSFSLDVGLIGVLRLLARRKGLIASVTSITALVGLVIGLVLPVRYTAVTKVMPPQQTQSAAAMFMSQLTSSSAGSLAAMAGAGLGGLKSPNDIYIGLLNSRPVADAIIQKFNLAILYHSKNMTYARKELAANTKILTESSGLISISVTDEDKQRAAAVANAYTGELRFLTKSLAVTEASQRRLFYEEQLKQSKDALLAAAVAFEQVQQQKGLVQLDAQARAMIEGLAALRRQIAAKQVEVQALRSSSTEENPSVRFAEAELTALQAEESRLEQRNQAPGIAGLGLGNVSSAGLEYVRAEHELHYQQGLYDTLMKQYDVAKLDESKEAAVVQAVEPAIPPDEKASPHRAAILLAFAMIGFMFGCSIAIAADFMRSNPNVARSLAELKSDLFTSR